MFLPNIQTNIQEFHKTPKLGGSRTASGLRKPQPGSCVPMKSIFFSLDWLVKPLYIPNVYYLTVCF